MKSLPVRIVSALVAVLLLIASYYFWGFTGVVIFAFSGCVVGVFEYARMMFRPPQIPRLFHYWFILITLILMGVTLYGTEAVFGFWGILLALFVSVGLWIFRGNPDNQTLIQAFAAAGLGFLYCALLPMTALKLFSLPNGDKWFVLLFFIAFAGDSFAYFGGILFGKTKLMPNISPNKTVAGSVSGIIGSMALGYGVSRWGLPHLSPLFVLALSAFGAFLAQNGDLFESLLKRVAGVKDSGQIMPGHGGILDRLDGIYFASPLIYTAALFAAN